MWNGTMFIDLDWPLNASSLLSASAELLVSFRIHSCTILGMVSKINIHCPRDNICPYTILLWSTLTLAKCCYSNITVHYFCCFRCVISPKKFWCAPTFLLCPPPHMRGHNDCLLPTERQLKCPLVSALQSAHLLVKSGEGQ